MTTKRYIPIIVVLLSIPCWWLAATAYPGGTSWDTTSSGFSVAKNYVSSLFQAVALNGMHNPARPFAFVAMLLYAAAMGYMFWAVSSSYPKSASTKTVQIFGAGSMVYAFIAVTTPMHDLLVLIAAAFLALATVGTLVLMYRARKKWLAAFGAFNMLLLALLTVSTKTDFVVKLGPGLEWLLFVLGALWVALAYLAATAPNQSLQRTRLTARR